jgi:type II secretory pathway pseudopilin PulG
MLKNKPTSTSPSRGFTIVEMLIIAPIVLLTIGAFVTVIVNMTGDVLATRSSNVLAYSIQDALNRIEDDIKLSTTFLEANNVSLTGSHQGFDNNVANFANVDNGTTTNGNMLILNTLATTGNPLSSTSGLVYLANQPNACASAQVNQNTPMTMNIVYFVKTVGGTSSLWRRYAIKLCYCWLCCPLATAKLCTGDNRFVL